MKVWRISKKIQERRLKRTGHVLQHCVGSPGEGIGSTRGGGRSSERKRKWLDRLRDDAKEKGLWEGRVRPY